MATIVSFKGKKIIEPGVYSQIKSGIPAKPSNFSFGNLMFIDTGSGAKYGGGSGINGEFSKGLNSVYGFTDVDDFKDFVKGGLPWDLANYIFNPLNGANGPETVYYARACTTTPAEIEFSLRGSSSGDAAIVRLKAKNEGEIGNGYVDETLAESIIRVDPGSPADVGVGGYFAIKVGSDEIARITLTADSVQSFSFLLAEMVEEINSGTSGYTAKTQGIDLILIAPRNTGSTLNDKAVTLTSGDDFVTGTTTPLTGGVDGTLLVQGYGAQMKISEDDNTKFVIEFYQGSYNGASPEGNHYGGIKPDQTKPILIATSPPFDNIRTFIEWAENDFSLNKVFELDPGWIIYGDGSVSYDNLTRYSTINLAVDGEETYNPADLDKLLTDIRELDNTFFLCDRWGDEAKGVQNTKILNYIQNDVEFGKFMVIAGGIDETKFEGDSNSSIEIAKYYDTTSVIVVHSGNKREVFNTGRFEKLPAIYHAANFIGRLGGLEPHQPATFKALRIRNFNHVLGIEEREKALQAGVVHNRFVPGIGNVINQAVNTLQRNTQLINTDGTSFEISIMRIGAQLNKELTLNMRPLFVGNSRGVATAADIKSFVEGYLLSRTSTTDNDDLIISFKNVTVRLIEDYYDIKYGFVPNGPINKLFITGFMLDSNL